MRERCFLVKKKKKKSKSYGDITLHIALCFLANQSNFFFFFCIIELLKPKLITSHMFFLEKIVKLKHIESK